MFRRKRHRGPALLLAFALLFTSQSVPAAAAESDIGTDVGTTAGVTSEISGGETITAMRSPTAQQASSPWRRASPM